MEMNSNCRLSRALGIIVGASVVGVVLGGLVVTVVIVLGLDFEPSSIVAAAGVAFAVLGSGWLGVSPSINKRKLLLRATLRH